MNPPVLQPGRPSRRQLKIYRWGAIVAILIGAVVTQLTTTYMAVPKPPTTSMPVRPGEVDITGFNMVDGGTCTAPIWGPALTLVSVVALIVLSVLIYIQRKREPKQ
jgi:hypothetical protein